MSEIEIDSKINEINSKVIAGSEINYQEGLFLYEHAETQLLKELSNVVRARVHPGKDVTYLVDRNINYTNVCNTDCSFCAFYRHSPKHPESYVLSKEVLAQKIQEAKDFGATRILLQGGHNDELPYSYYIELVKWIHNDFPTIEINAFSPSEIHQMHLVSGKSYFEILQELQTLGLRSLPGGGAEILDDEIRKKVSPKKISADLWIKIMEDAQDLGLTTTSTMVIGFDETLVHRMNHLERLKNTQIRSISKGGKGFNLFVSWALQHNEKTSIGRSKNRDLFGSSIEEYLRHIAFCRIYLECIPHHQASWPTFGPEVAAIGLNHGCDDIGSTMMEENVVSQAGAPTKDRWCVSPEELKQYITGAGYMPLQRNTSFQRVL